MTNKTDVNEGSAALHCFAAIQRARRWAEHEMKPFVDLIVRVRLLERPSYLLTKDGLEQVSDGLDDSQRSIIDQCEKCIREIIDAAERMCSAAYRL